MLVFLGKSTELPCPEEVTRVLGPEAKHINVRKPKAGTEIFLANSADKVVWVQFVHVDSCEVHVRVIATEERPRPCPHVTVVWALLKPDRTELAVDLMIGAGVNETIPWAAVDCVARQQGVVKVTKARARWQLVVHEAAKQTRRAWTPPVADLHSFADIEQLIRETTLIGDVTVVLHEEETAPFVRLAVQAADIDKILFIVGPEGGISPGESEAFRATGASSIVLGPTVLHSVLAGATALCALGPLAKR